MAGIYLHIPFCRRACNYCNFHFSTSLKQKDEMVAAIVKEVELTPYFTHHPKTLINTIYFGGGTPSILAASDLQLILNALHKKFTISQPAEVTLEANPDDITAEKLAQWKALGINRFSLGIQSFDDQELQWMNRSHTGTQALQCIDGILHAGFTNFSVDLIYGSPLLTNDGWKKNIEIILQKQIPHVSCYALTIEPKTALDKMIALKKKENVDPEKQAQQFLLLMDLMQTGGYNHYEISNFSLPDKHSRHNSSYWSGELYYGFGPSAHSFSGSSRCWNVANNALYISQIQKGILPFEEEILTPRQRLNEYIITALRTDAGLRFDFITKNFGADKTAVIKLACAKWVESKKIIQRNEKLTLTQEGKLFADGIAADLLFID
jgi:oxygen-independent coproporphyrinogen III oxidase